MNRRRTEYRIAEHDWWVEVAAASPSNLLNPTHPEAFSYPDHLPIINPTLIQFQQFSRTLALFFGETILIHQRDLQADGQPCRLLWSPETLVCASSVLRKTLSSFQSLRASQHIIKHCRMQYQGTGNIARPSDFMYESIYQLLGRNGVLNNLRT